MQSITEPGQSESANRLATCWRVEGSIPTKDQDTPVQPTPLSNDTAGFLSGTRRPVRESNYLHQYSPWETIQCKFTKFHTKI